MKQTGKILWYSTRDGFGQIKGDDGNRYYVDDSVLSFDIVEFSNPLVEFELNPRISTPLCSMNVSKRERV